MKVRLLCYSRDVLLPLSVQSCWWEEKGPILIWLSNKGWTLIQLHTCWLTTCYPQRSVAATFFFFFFNNLYRKKKKVNSCAAEKQAICPGIFGEALRPQLGARGPWWFHNETSIDFGFSIRNSGWIPFHLAASQMVWMGKWPSLESLFIKCGENRSISEARQKKAPKWNLLNHLWFKTLLNPFIQILESKYN